jgi:sugar/nucleoside kinase (ribokinase family)
VAKANQWRHEANENKAKVAELEARLAEAQAKQEQAKASDIESVAKEVAGEDASPEVVKRILEAAKKMAPSEDLQAVKVLKQKLEEQHEEQSFNRDLNQTLAKFPELKGHETELKELAYAEGNEKIPLRLLAYQLKEDLNLSPAPPSAEGKSSKPPVNEEPDYASMNEKDIAGLTDVELDKFLEWQTKGLKQRTGVRL